MHLVSKCWRHFCSRLKHASCVAAEFLLSNDKRMLIELLCFSLFSRIKRHSFEQPLPFFLLAMDVSFLGLTAKKYALGQLSHVEVLNSDLTLGMVSKNQLMQTHEEVWKHITGPTRERLSRHLQSEGPAISEEAFARAALLYAWIYLKKYSAWREPEWEMGVDSEAWNQVLQTAFKLFESSARFE